MSKIIFVIIFVISSCKITFGFKTGAPSGSCDNLTPHHEGTTAELSASPYQILLSPGQTRIIVLLGSRQGFAYKGFIMNARDIATGQLVGEFTVVPKLAKSIECITDIKNGVTHTDTTDKRNLEFEWVPPVNFEGTIVFNATFVQDWSTYWVGVESDRVDISRNNIVIMSTLSPPLPPPSPKTTTTIPYYDLAMRKKDIEKPKRAGIYEGCGKLKNCFGTPDGCIDTADCKAIVAIDVKGEKYTFELLGEGGKYVALGISNDEKMGDDSVVECVDEADAIKIYMSWNDGKKNNRITNTGGMVKLQKSFIEDGHIYCQFTRDTKTIVNNREFNMENNAYYLLLAIGNKVTKNGIGYHDILREASSQPKKLSDIGEFTAASDVLIRLHGALMIASWIGTASIGILMARYYKQTWLRSKICGNDQWFVWHRFFMILTWAMTIAASVLIFVEIGEWSSATIHASFGAATTILTFIQPFMAALRPHPGTPRRSLFNWTHWLVGNAAHIFAIIALFFAVGLSKAKLPDWMEWILVAYVIFHVITHIILSFAGCASDKRNSQRVNAFPMKDIHGRGSMAHQDVKRDAPLASMRKFIFGIYILVILAFTMIFIILTVFAPFEESWNTLTNKMTSY
ncbi:putative ferric-chelate reductase 1 homolog isoform X2 [Aphidius gifuensis]|nr:putative ferric-chelate reductase 1 homolog isoform X2 [Aphidius gifuensis]